MKPVTKAVIPAAGFGTRFLPFTKSVPKEMIPLIDKPVIQYVIEEAVQSGITDILIVISTGKNAIQDHFNPVPDLMERLERTGKATLLEELKKIDSLADIHYVYQQELKGLGDAVLRAEKFIGDDPFAILLGDTVTTSDTLPVTAQLVKACGETGGSVTALEEVPAEKTSRYGILDGIPVNDRLYKVNTYVEKPSPEEAPSHLAIASRYLFTPAIFSFLKEAKPGKGGEIQLTDAMRAMAKAEPMYGFRVDGKRHDIGNKLDFIKSTVTFALKRPEFQEEIRTWLRELSRNL